MIIHNTPMRVHNTPKMKMAAHVEMSEKSSGSCEFMDGAYIRNFLVTQGKIVALFELITFWKFLTNASFTGSPSKLT
jgi:hypothetical protein